LPGYNTIIVKSPFGKNGVQLYAGAKLFGKFEGLKNNRFTIV